MGLKSTKRLILQAVLVAAAWETVKGFNSFAARKSAGRRTGLTAAKVMKPCSELNRRRRVGL